MVKNGVSTVFKLMVKLSPHPNQCKSCRSKTAQKKGMKKSGEGLKISTSTYVLDTVLTLVKSRKLSTHPLGFQSACSERKPGQSIFMKEKEGGYKTKTLNKSVLMLNIIPNISIRVNIFVRQSGSKVTPQCTHPPHLHWNTITLVLLLGLVSHGEDVVNLSISKTKFINWTAWQSWG